MLITSIISIIVFFSVIILILFSFKNDKKKLSRKKFLKIDYATAPIIGVIILFITFSFNTDLLINGIIGTDKIQPYAIIVLFMSLAYLSISIDSTGLFEYLAFRIAKSAGNSGARLFFYFYFLSSLLTLFTSNDIVILTLTPIIIYFCRQTKANPIPYIIAQFFAANIWSITLYIGNPTNIIVAQANNLTFVEYTSWTLLPTITAGLVCLGLLWLLFRKQIPRELEMPELDARSLIRDKFGATFGICSLICCLITLSLASWLNISLWLITLFFALILLVYNVIHLILVRKRGLKTEDNAFTQILRRMPWKIISFVLGMFILVEALAQSGWVDLLASLFASFSNNLIISILFMGLISTLACNLMNNQPMTILFTQILLNGAFVVPSANKFGTMFALIMGSNFGANLTLIGALAGLMWHKIAQSKDVNIKFTEFAKYGFIVMPIVMISSFLILFLEILFFFP